jgi:hypothetical protein
LPVAGWRSFPFLPLPMQIRNTVPVSQQLATGNWQLKSED